MRLLRKARRFAHIRRAFLFSKAGSPAPEIGAGAAG